MALTISLLWLQAIQDMMKSHGHEPVNFGDIKVHYVHTHTLWSMYVMYYRMRSMTWSSQPTPFTSHCKTSLLGTQLLVLLNVDNNGVSLPQWPRRDSGEHTD